MDLRKIKETGLSFFKRRITKKSLWVVLLCWAALFAFLYFREVKTEVLELNTLATRYIVAQIDFEFPDDNATLMVKQEALREAGPIYRMEPSELRQVRFELENELLHEQSWREIVPFSNYEKMSKTADLLENILLDLRFTDARTLQKIQEFHLFSDNFLSFSSVLSQKKIILPKEYWDYFKEIFLERASDFFEEVQEETLDFVVKFFSKREWKFVHDLSSEENLKQRIESSIPQKFTQVKAGTSLISQGEKVAARHVAMLMAMNKALTENRNLASTEKILGGLLLSLLFLLLSIGYFRTQEDMWRSFSKLMLFVFIFFLTLALSKITEMFLLSGSNNLMEKARYPIFVPFAVILTTIFLNSRSAFFQTLLLLVVLSVTLSFDQSHFLIVNFFTSLIILLSAKSLSQRKEVFLICMRCFLIASVVMVAFYLLSPERTILSFACDIGSSFIFLVITAVLVVGFLPVIENLFPVMADISLMEYMDPNSELLRRLILEMPGTYQHSLVLGNLSENAARAIRANALLCRGATLYHDIGKLSNIQYFTENQPEGFNSHELLTPVESAALIISHIKAGEELAHKYRLPESFIDIIREHHGTTLVYYFYCKEVERKGGDVSLVDESLFRYPGPKPRSKEAAIVMIADMVEAASRTLSKVTEEVLTEMIDRLVADKAEDGQFDDCPLTFEDLKKIKQELVKTLLVIHHVRIKYPEKK